MSESRRESMNRLAGSGFQIDELSGEILLIHPPRRKLLRLAAILYFAEVILIGVTFNYLIAFITIPIMIFWFYYYYMFCRIWTAYYSKFYLVAVPIICIPVGFMLLWLIMTLI